MNAASAALVAVAIAGTLAAATQCSNLGQRDPPPPAAAKQNKPPEKSFAEQVGEQVRAEREARERDRADEFAKNRAKIIANVRLLVQSKQWDKAEAITREYRHVKDAELSKLDNQATDAIYAKQQAAAKAAAKRQGVTIGMSKEQVLGSSWGKPQNVNRTINAYGEREQWVYGGRNYLYFENGTLTSIQN